MVDKEYKENEEGKLSADELNDDTLEAVNGGSLPCIVITSQCAICGGVGPDVCSFNGKFYCKDCYSKLA